MDVQTLQRKAVDGYLRTVRKPLDLALGLLPDGGADGGAVTGVAAARSSVELTLDRADAALREVAGRLMGDDELRADALRRRIAADERERALRLKAEAEVRSQEADAEFRRRQEEAEQRRLQAEQQAEQQRQRIEAERQEEKRRVAEQAARQKANVRKAAAKTETALEKQARQ
ncbi:MAG TPA: hypothetical protein VGB03_06135, partial [Acidimicrobiales bacterium]